MTATELDDIMWLLNKLANEAEADPHRVLQEIDPTFWKELGDVQMRIFTPFLSVTNPEHLPDEKALVKIAASGIAGYLEKHGKKPTLKKQKAKGVNFGLLT